MPLYFLLLDGRLFHQAIRPALAAAWRRRSFEPCRPLAARLEPAVRAFVERYHLGAEEPLLTQVARGLSFDRHFWTLLAGEALLYGAAEVPEFQTAPETLCCLLAPEQFREGEVPRERFAPIQQAHFGSRDLDFGGKLYRPEYAGYNDTADVARLAAYLGGVDPGRWSPADLTLLPGLADDEERAEELEFARDWFPALRDLYRRAEAQGQIVVCELLSGRDC
jgi:hypothetical protein